MTISTTTSRAEYAGNGVTTVFAFPYPFFADGDLTVLLLRSTGVVDTLVLNTDYTVSGEGTPSSGQVTLMTAPASGESLFILRELTLTQETDYISGDPFPAESHEQALDRLTLIAQQQQEQLGRSLTLNPTASSGVSTELPVPDANALIGWNTAANGLQNYAGTSSVLVSSAMEPVVTAATLADARSELGATVVGDALFTATSVNAAQGAVLPTAAAGGTADAITATFSPNVTVLTNGLRVRLTGLLPNATTTPNLTAGTTAATTIKNPDGTAISIGQIGPEQDFIYSSALTGWLLQPAGRSKTQAVNDSSTKNATTAFIQQQIASTAEAQAGTNDTKLISPLKVRDAFNASGSAPVYACRAWVNFNGTGTVAIRASGNVSSITDNGIGDYTVNFTTAMPDANYAMTGSLMPPAASSFMCAMVVKNGTTPTISAITVQAFGGAGPTATVNDTAHAMLSFFR